MILNFFKYKPKVYIIIIGPINQKVKPNLVETLRAALFSSSGTTLHGSRGPVWRCVILIPPAFTETKTLGLYYKIFTYFSQYFKIKEEPMVSISLRYLDQNSIGFCKIGWKRRQYQLSILYNLSRTSISS